MSNRNHKWLNQDGLFVGFGTRTVEQNTGAKISTSGQEQEIRVKVKGTGVKTAVAAGDLENSAVIPAGAFVLSAVLRVDAAFTSGGSATFNAGTYNADTKAAVAATGLISAQAVAGLTLGATITGAGAVVGTRITAPVNVGVNFGVAAFTAGEGTLIVKYIVPAA